MGEGGVLCVRSWNANNDSLFEQQYLNNRQDLPEYLQKLIALEYCNSTTNGFNSSQSSSNQNTSLNLSGSSKNVPFGGGGGSNSGVPTLPSYQIVFMTTEKPSVSSRRRIEGQVIQNMHTSLIQIGKKESVHILVLDLPSQVLKSVAGAIDPRDTTFKDTRDEISFIIER